MLRDTLHQLRNVAERGDWQAHYNFIGDWILDFDRMRVGLLMDANRDRFLAYGNPQDQVHNSVNHRGVVSREHGWILPRFLSDEWKFTAKKVRLIRFEFRKGKKRGSAYRVHHYEFIPPDSSHHFHPKQGRSALIPSADAGFHLK